MKTISEQSLCFKISAHVVLLLLTFVLNGDYSDAQVVLAV